MPTAIEYVMEVSNRAAVKALKQIQAGAKGAGGALKDAGVAAAKVGAGMGVAFGAASLAAFGAFKAIQGVAGIINDLNDEMKAFTHEAVDMINDLGDIANRSGVAAETIGALKAAFKASGQDAGDVVNVLDVTSKRLALLAEGNVKVVETFDAFGIAVKDTEGRMRSNNEILVDTMLHIQGLEDTSERSRAALLLLGKGGQKLSQALGAGNFFEFLNFVDRFGAKAGPEAAKQAALFQDSLSLMEVAFQGLRQEFVFNSDLMKFFASQMKVAMAVAAGLKDVTTEFADELKMGAEFLSNFAQGVVGFFALALSGSHNANTGINALVENIFRAAQGLLDFVLMPIQEALFHMRNLASFTDNTGLAQIFEKGRGAILALREFTNLDNAGAQDVLATAVKGANEALENMAKITAGATHTTQGLGGQMIETSDAVEEATEQFDALGASISMVSNAMSNLGLPPELTPDGLRQLVEQVQILGEGLSAAGDERRFRASRFSQNDPNNVAQQIGQQIMQAAPKIGVAIAVFAGFKKLIQVAERLGGRGETVAEIQQSVETDIRARAKAIELGLKALPPILFETLPPILKQLAFDLLIGLADLFTDLIVGLRDAIKERITAPFEDGFFAAGADAALNFTKKFINAINLGDTDVFRAGGPFIPSARSGIRFTGAEEGLAMLHRGEFVVPETGQMPQAVQRTMGGQNGGIVLNINAAVVEQNAVEELVRMIERRFSTFGQSTSPLFGA